MTNSNANWLKPYEAHREHFIERLAERYGIHLSEPEYDHIVSYEYIHRNFLGIAKRSQHKTVGILHLHGTDVLVLYDNDSKVLRTAYPASSFHDRVQLIACFFPQYYRHVALRMWAAIDEELSSPYAAIIKDKTIYFDGRDFIKSVYQNCMFPGLVLMKVRNKPVGWQDAIRTIWSVIRGEHPNTRLGLEHYKKVMPPKKGGKDLVNPDSCEPENKYNN